MFALNVFRLDLKYFFAGEKNVFLLFDIAMSFSNGFKG